MGRPSADGVCHAVNVTNRELLSMRLVLVVNSGEGKDAIHTRILGKRMQHLDMRSDCGVVGRR